jgi:O-acetyl-ADP-ribose deacetylase (regulator of RNase III)
MVFVDLDGVRLEVCEGDLTQATTVAVANAANNHLWMGAGVAGALKRAGGPEIEEEAMAQGPVAVGSAVITSAGRLPYRAIVHGAVMGQDLRTTPELIARTTRACLEAAEGQGLESLALPAFGTGVGGVALADAARAMIASAVEFAAGGPRVLRSIVFVLLGFDAFHVFATELQALTAPGSLG